MINTMDNAMNNTMDNTIDIKEFAQIFMLKFLCLNFKHKKQSCWLILCLRFFYAYIFILKYFMLIKFKA